MYRSRGIGPRIYTLHIGIIVNILFLQRTHSSLFYIYTYAYRYIRKQYNEKLFEISNLKKHKGSAPTQAFSVGKSNRNNTRRAHILPTMTSHIKILYIRLKLLPLSKA